MDRSLVAGVQKTIETRDPATACHQASERPYLGPRVPDAPEGRMIEFSPSGS
jgi:hypothetical protein